MRELIAETFQGNSSDIESSTQSEGVSKLKKLLTYYKEITDTVREPFIILDDGLCVVSANNAFYDVFRVSDLETEGQLIYTLGSNQWDSKELRELLENILPEHRFFNGFEITHDFPDIGKRTMLLNARQIDSKQLILLAFEDITAQKKLKKDAKKMKDDLKVLSDAKDEFIMLASHQLRTPASIVKIYTGMLRDGYSGELTKDQIKMLDRAMYSNERQLEIIEDLLRVASVENGKVNLVKTDTDLIKLINGVIKEQLVKYKSNNQEITFNNTTDKITAHLDINLMRMVFENLIDNASKYSRDNQTIKVRVHQTKKDTVITISDDGVGVLKADHEKMFTKFSRIENPLSASTSGTGLGLYWVKKIIDLHEGTIKVQSKVEEGTKFTISLPILAAVKDQKK